MSNGKLPQISELYTDAANNVTAVHPEEILNIDTPYLNDNSHSRNTSTLRDIKYLHDLLD